jgi:hypothetical protein
VDFVVFLEGERIWGVVRLKKEREDEKKQHQRKERKKER